MYYGADDKLALANRHGGISAVSDDSRPGARGVWEMHRYDALGRRVMTHAVRGSSCPVSAAECASVVERTVWDGDQLFYEIRTPDTTPANDQPAGGTYHAYGRVAYLHAGSIDAPLAVTRMDLSGQPAEVTVAPHAGWQGGYVGGSLMNGTSQEGCTGASGCPLIDWPGAKQTADGLPINPPSNAWWGRLINEQLDGSGLKYQRNRFYDPTTGQFTQQDPVGLAGGVNLYAFAGGDPVNFRDPYGLTACPPECGVLDAADLVAGATPGVSTVVDAVTTITGRNPVTGEQVGGAGRFIAAVGLVTPFGAGEIRAGGKAVSLGRHYLEQKLARGVRSADVWDALKNPLAVKGVKLDAFGKPSQQIVGRNATVVQNPETGHVISTWPTSGRKAEKLAKQKESP